MAAGMTASNATTPTTMNVSENASISALACRIVARYSYAQGDTTAAAGVRSPVDPWPFNHGTGPSARPSGAQRSTTFTSRPPRTSTRCIIEPPSICEAPCHLTLLVTYQTPSGTRGKEKLPATSQGVVRRVET